MKNSNEKIIWKEIYNPKYLLLNWIGVACITIGIKAFMIPNNFLDGGVTGVCLFIHEAYHIPFGILTVVLNLPFLFLGKKLLGKTFTVQTAITISLLAISMTVIEIPPIKTDPLLIALFGGCLIGVGIGICIRGGSAADGAEILAVITTHRIGFSISEVIFAMNAVLFLTAAWYFGLAIALYSIVTYFAAAQSLDYVADGIEQYTALHVISGQSEKVKSLIVNDFGKGITVLKGERGYLPESFQVKSDCDIIVTIVTRLELLRIRNAILEMDPEAFLYIQYIKEARGGILKYRRNH